MPLDSKGAENENTPHQNYLLRRRISLQNSKINQASVISVFREAWKKKLQRNRREKMNKTETKRVN